MRRRFVILLALILGVVALWSGGWLLATIWLRGQIAAQANLTPSLACAELGIGGFPFRLNVTCTGALLTEGDTQIEIAEVHATALAYMPSFIELFALAPASYDDAFSGASYRLGWDDMQASVRLDGFSLIRASLVGNGLVLNDTVLDVTEMARAKHLEIHALGADGATGEDNRNLSLFARVDEAVLPQVEAPVMAEAAAHLTEWPGDVRGWGAADILPVWAAGEGALQIDKAEMTTGELFAHASGTLTPDEKGLIDGELTLISRGFGPLMREYLAAPLAGALLGPEDANGQARQTIAVTQSILRVGIVPLLLLPPLF
jgi:hypothetical protein